MRHRLHDLRTPVHVIAGWVGMLGQVPGEATRVRATEAIERNAKRLSRSWRTGRSDRCPGSAVPATQD